MGGKAPDAAARRHGGDAGRARCASTGSGPVSLAQRHPSEVFMPAPKQPVTDDSIQVRQLSHYQFTWVAGEPAAPGTWTLQLVLDQGAWEEVLTIDPDDADNLQDMLSTASVVHYDVRRQTLMFGTTPVGST
jgi:hypothetical protein